MGTKRPKKAIIENGETKVWCSGHKKYLPESDFYPVSGRRYDTYCKECRKEKEHSFYNRYKKGNPDYMPTIRRRDNEHLFIGGAPKPKPKRKKDYTYQEEYQVKTAQTVNRDKDGKPLLVPRRFEYNHS